MKSSKRISSRGAFDLLDRGIAEVVRRDHLLKALKSKKPLRIKLGIDPTSPDLHLGHSVVLRKLRQFQDLGHKVVLIIGDFTAMIGDPSGNSKTRPSLSNVEIKKNMRDYLKQAGKIINVKQTEVHYNSRWLGKLDAAKMVRLLSLVSVSQVLDRDDFKRRLRENKPVALHETLYPVMQAYDSVMVKADVEIGGTDQTFNLLLGRDLMEKFGMKPQDILTVPLLEGTDGEKKMSKSLGNYIGLNDEPNDMFGKVMSIPDKLVLKYFGLCTGLVDTILRKQADSRDRKIRLAYEIVKIYHGEKPAKKAQEEFSRVFQKRELPSDIKKIYFRKSPISLVDILVGANLATSRSQARQLIIQGGVSVDGQRIINPREAVSLSRKGYGNKAKRKPGIRRIKKPYEIGKIVKVGKRNFLRALF